MGLLTNLLNASWMWSTLEWKPFEILKPCVSTSASQGCACDVLLARALGVRLDLLGLLVDHVGHLVSGLLGVRRHLVGLLLSLPVDWLAYAPECVQEYALLELLGVLRRRHCGSVVLGGRVVSSDKGGALSARQHARLRPLRELRGASQLLGRCMHSAGTGRAES